MFGGGTGTPNVYYQYDGADELTLDSMPTTSTAYPNAYTYRYAYDHNANRLSKDWGTGTVDGYTYDSADKMTAAGGYTFTYDANGNMTGVSSGGTAAWSYYYDCENRMVTSKKLPTGSGTDTNTYNGLGFRVANVDFAGSYTNMTDGVDATSAVLDDGIELFTPGFSSEDMTAGGLKYYTEPDQIGTTLGMTNTSQSQIYGVEYDAYGDIVGTSGSFTDTYAFMDGYAGTNGYQTDRDTGFIRCGNRFYSPYFGRFITQDPAGTGTNWYDYCDNDPTGEIDPDGLSWQWEQAGQPQGSFGGPGLTDDGGEWQDSNGNWHPDSVDGAWVWVDDGTGDYSSQAAGGGLMGYGAGLAFALRYQSRTKGPGFGAGQVMFGKPNARGWIPKRSIGFDLDGNLQYPHVNAEIGPIKFFKLNHEPIPTWLYNLGSESAVKRIAAGAGAVGAAITVYSVVSAPANQRGAAIGSAIGSIVGDAVGGAVGSALLPGLGTFVGGAAGGVAFSYLGGEVGSLFDH